MKYCNNCGKELNPNAEVCMNCGVKVNNSTTGEDNGGMGYTLLGFFIPIVGLVLWLMWKDTKPNCSQAAKKGFLAYVIVWAAFMALSIVFNIFGAMF